jgi:hypothetical protein
MPKPHPFWNWPPLPLKSLLGLALFQNSFPSFCLICFMQLVKGLGPRLGFWIWVGTFSSLLFFGVVSTLMAWGMEMMTSPKPRFTKFQLPPRKHKVRYWVWGSCHSIDVCLFMYWQVQESNLFCCGIRMLFGKIICEKGTWKSSALKKKLTIFRFGFLINNNN